jgi:hypothetical protein
MAKLTHLLVLGALLTPFWAVAQEDEGPGAVFRVEVDMVLLNVAVTDKKGNYVTDLRPWDFRVSEDGIGQALATFAAMKPQLRMNVTRVLRCGADLAVLYNDWTLTGVGPDGKPFTDGGACQEGSYDGSWTLDDQEAGICLFMLLSKHSDHPEANAWGYVDWLHVAEAQRRRGLGRYLMTWTLQRLWEQGCCGCWLTTGANNWPAQPLYLSLGFEILDTSSSWEKLLSAG